MPPASLEVGGKFKLAKPIPDKGTVFDVVFSEKKGYNWVEWMSTVDAYTVPKGATFSDIFVTTEDGVQAGYLTTLLINHAVPLLVTGNTGTGKTTLVRAELLAIQDTIDSEGLALEGDIMDIYRSTNEALAYEISNANGKDANQVVAASTSVLIAAFVRQLYDLSQYHAEIGRASCRERV